MTDEQPVIRFAAVGPLRTRALLRQEPKQVRRSDGHVQMEVELLLTASLTVRESGVLLRIADHKLNLIAQAVVPDDLFGGLTGISGSENDLFVSIWTLPGADQKDDPEIAPEVRAVGYRGEDPNLWLIWKTPDFVESAPEFVEVVPVNFAVVLFGPARAFALRTGVQVAQIRIRAEPRDEVSSEICYGVKDLLLRVEAVPHPVGDAQLGKRLVQIDDLFQVEVDAGVAAGLSRKIRRRLGGIDPEGTATLRCNDAENRYFQSLLRAPSQR